MKLIKAYNCTPSFETTDFMLVITSGRHQVPLSVRPHICNRTWSETCSWHPARLLHGHAVNITATQQDLPRWH